MIEILIPKFTPDTSNARKVTFSRPDEINDDRRCFREKIKEEKRQRQISLFQLRTWQRKRDSQARKVRNLRDSLKRAIKTLEEIDSEKPLYQASNKVTLDAIPVFAPPESPSEAQQAVT